MKIFTITNQKGGVGKSTTSHALGAYLATRRKKSVLLIDLDAQANLTFISDVKNFEITSADVLLSPADVKKAVLPVSDNLFIIPAAQDNYTVADKLQSVTGREYRLKEALELLDFDYCVIDTPPALSVLTINALTVADKVVIPAQADVLSLKSFYELSDTIETVRKYTNSDLKVSGLLLTRYNPRNILTKDLTGVLDDSCKKLNTKLFKARIREAIAIKEAQAKKTDIFSYAPESNVAGDYKEFCEELLNE